MTEIHEPTATDVLRSLRLIRSPDPAERLRALRVLGALHDDPRVLQVFEHLYEGDPDASVRAAAWQVLCQHGPSIPAPGPTSLPPDTAPVVTATPLPAAAPLPSTAVESAAPAPRSAPLPAKSAPTPTAGPPAPRAASNAPFLLNPDHARRVRQEARQQARRRTGRGRLAFRLALALMFLVVAVVALVLPDWVTWYEFRQRGITLQGTISAREARDGQYYLHYVFEVAEDGELVPYAGRQRVTATAYRVYRADIPVAVTYLHGAPQTSRLDVTNPGDWTRDRLTIASAGWLTVVLALLGLSLVQRTRPQGLPGRSPLIRGQVVACQGRMDDDGDFKITVQYRFRAPGGDVKTGQARQLRNDLHGVTLPAPGSPVVVEYQNARAYRLL